MFIAKLCLHITRAPAERNDSRDDFAIRCVSLRWSEGKSVERCPSINIASLRDEELL